MNSVYGVRSIHPKSICNFLSLKKGISMERQCLHISNPRFTKITSWRNNVHHAVECCTSSGKLT